MRQKYPTHKHPHTTLVWDASEDISNPTSDQPGWRRIFLEAFFQTLSTKHKLQKKRQMEDRDMELKPESGFLPERCSTGSTLLTTYYQNQALDPPWLKLVCQFHEKVMTDKKLKIMVGSKEKLSKRLQQGRIQDQENKLVMVLKLWVIQLQSCIGIEVKLFSLKINTV